MKKTIFSKSINNPILPISIQPNQQQQQQPQPQPQPSSSSLININPIHQLSIHKSSSSSSHSRSNSLHSRFTTQPISTNLSSSDSLSQSTSSLPYHHHHPSNLINLKSILFSRSRITNLAVIILSIILSISLYFNLLHQSSKLSSQPLQLQSSLHSIQSTLPKPKKPLKNLIIVPGHAIFVGKDPMNPSDWLLEPYQSNTTIISFINHIKEAIKLMLLDSDALLVYSGGQTRLKSNQTASEAASYSRVAHLLDLYQTTHHQLLEESEDHGKQKDRKLEGLEGLGNRVTTEEFALDSWTNLLFSVARFKEFTGHYPSRITIIGHAYKSKRFHEIHREALRWPSTRFEYVSIQDETTEKEIETRYLFEQEVFHQFSTDKYGCSGKLRRKKLMRNPFRRFHSYLIGAFELIGLFEWCPSNGIDWYPGPLPWSNLT